MRHDLHIHTTASDGVLSPTEVVDAAHTGGLHVIAVSDHDTVKGVAEAKRRGAEVGLTVLTATEVSSTHQGREVHILGYGVDPAAPVMSGLDERARTRRVERMSEMVDRLRESEVEVTMEDVFTAAGPAHHMIGRPHLARALVDRGHASSVANAFDRWISDRHPAFVPTDLGSPERAIETILEAGGLPVWAHPPGDLLADLLSPLVDVGLRGLELYRPSMPNRVARRIREAAAIHRLLVTGGSDWHNPDRNDPLGTFWVTSGQLADFRGEVGLDGK